jgi:CDP-paratose 2-epimerase
MIYLITGGAGFVGASFALFLKQKYPDSQVIAVDNLKRRGSELNLPRLREKGIEFIHGDIRNKEDLESIGKVHTIIECAAEPSVLSGYTSSPDYLVNTNLIGTYNCLEYARKHKAVLIILSTSRVYPFNTINSLNFYETRDRFELDINQTVKGCSEAGFTEDFPLTGPRSLYGTTKLASELLIQEYVEMYNLKAVINRCGVICGPWQFGKIDQGVIVLWIAKHFWKQELSCFGFGGEGKQVRDILHIKDLFRLIDYEAQNIDQVNGEIFNVGGGREISVSLKELTALCREYTGNTIPINKVSKNRPADVRIYLTDNTKVTKMTGWVPTTSVRHIIEEITEWIKNNAQQLEGVLK